MSKKINGDDLLKGSSTTINPNIIEHIYVRVLENSSENKCTFHKEDRNIICSDSPPHIFHHWQRWGEKFSAVVNILSFAQFTWSSLVSNVWLYY